MTSPTLKCRPHTPSYLWVTQKCCVFGVSSGIMVKFFMNDVSKNWKFGQKTQFVAPKSVILGNLGQKRSAKGPDVVLPKIQSYPEIAWDMGMIS